MNRPLRGYDGSWGWSHYKGVGNVPLNREHGEDHIKALYSALEKSVTKKDMWLQRGNENWEGVEGFFGVKIYQKQTYKSLLEKRLPTGVSALVEQQKAQDLVELSLIYIVLKEQRHSTLHLIRSLVTRTRLSYSLERDLE